MCVLNMDALIGLQLSFIHCYLDYEKIEWVSVI